MLFILLILDGIASRPSTLLQYEGDLESSKHGIITPQCVDKMLSNYTFLDTRIQPLLDGLIFVEKGLSVHV